MTFEEHMGARQLQMVSRKGRRRLAAVPVHAVRAVVGALALLILWNAGNAAAQGAPACPDEVRVLTDWALKPAGVGPGDRFRLIFVTSGNYSPQSRAIATYNTQVQNLAAAGHTAIRRYSSGFRLLGSTPNADARDNTCSTSGTDVPAIYWLNGNKVADDYADFYDGSWDDETDPKDESGNGRYTGTDGIWTGTNNDGTAAGDAVLGRNDGLLQTIAGRLNFASGDPLSSALVERLASVRKPYYAMSQVFRVRHFVPVANPLVANFDQSAGSGVFNVLSNVSQSFTTGTHAGGYHLESIATKLTQSRSFAMSLCATDSRGRPTSTCTSLTAPSTTTAGSPVVFSAPANTILEPETTYAAVLSGFHNRLKLDYTQSGGEDSTSATGWSIGNAYHLWHPGSSSWYRRAGVILRLAVRGAPKTVSVAPGAPRNLMASPGTSQVELNWDAPSTSGGVEITDYEIRHAQGTSVPDATSWTSAGSDRTETVTGLTSGQQYTFEVRAANSAGSGAAASVQATVTTATPFTARFANVPASHRGATNRLHYDNVATNDFTFELHFSVDPTSLTSYTKVPRLLEVSGGEVLKARRLDPPKNLAWEVRVRPTQNGDITITLPVRACSATNAVCAGGQSLAAAVSATVKGRSLSASFSDVPPEHDGSTFTLDFSLSHEPDLMSFTTVRDSLFDVTGGAIEYVRRVRPGQNREWELRVRPSSVDAVTLTVKATTACDSPPGICAGGQMLPGGREVTVPGPAALSVVSPFSVREGQGDPLLFRVTLSRPRPDVTTVDYATSDGTATEGADYTATSGTLTFNAGQTTRDIQVTLLNDNINEGNETVMMTISNPTPSAYARISQATATGLIVNTDPIPQAWIARFGRTVAEQVLDAVENRLRAARTPGVEVSLAGERIGLGPVFGDAARTGDGEAATALGTRRNEAEAEREAKRLVDWLKGETDSGEANSTGDRPVTEGELMLGSSFALTAAAHGRPGGTVSLWGRSAVTRFDGREGELTLDGEVTSGLLGGDWSRDRVTAGLIVGHSRGEGGYRAPSGGGTVSSTLTGVYPWGRYVLSNRLSVWGMAGYGEGTLTLTPEGQAAMRPDMDLAMGAVGVRGVLLDGGGEGPTLAAKSDAMAVRTGTEAVRGLSASEAEVTRLRLALEGSLPVALGGDAVLTPSLELGARHDGGDAETGFGTDIGAGLALWDPLRGLSAEFRARGLLTHEADGMRERGISGTLSFDPAPDSERGLSLRLTQTLGGPSSGGAEGLMARQTLAGLGAEDADDGSGRLDARVGYGLGVFGARWTAVPELGLGLSQAEREVRLGWRLTRAAPGEIAFELGAEARRLDRLDGSDGPDHEIGVGLGWRLDGAGAGALGFETRIEARRREPGNDNEDPDQSVGLRVTARW